MRVIIDRFEKDLVVVELENKSRVNMPKELMPQGAKEGDVLEITINKKETEKRQERISNLMDNLWK